MPAIGAVRSLGWKAIVGWIELGAVGRAGVIAGDSGGGAAALVCLRRLGAHPNVLPDLQGCTRPPTSPRRSRRYARRLRLLTAAALPDVGWTRLDR
jgi:hypothetical protein